MSPELARIVMSFAAGLVVGLTSVGGAALVTPFLMLGLGVPPVVAVGTDLAYSSITKLAGAAMHWRQQTVDYRLALQLAWGSVPGGLLGFLALESFRSRGVSPDRIVQSAVGATLILVAAVLLVRTLADGVPRAKAGFFGRRRTAVTVGWGGVVGFIVGLTSIGSGSLIAIYLLPLFPAAPAMVVGTGVFHAAILVTVTAGLHSGAGHVDWRLTAMLLGGAVPGVLVGSWLAPRMPVRALRVGLGVVLAASGWKLL